MELSQKGRVRLSALHLAAKKDDVRSALLLLQNNEAEQVTNEQVLDRCHSNSAVNHDSDLSPVSVINTGRPNAVTYSITPCILLPINSQESNHSLTIGLCIRFVINLSLID